MFGTKQHDDNKDDKKWFVSCNDATNWPFRNNNSIYYAVEMIESVVIASENVFFQAEDGIRDSVASRGLGDVYKRQQ